MTDARVLAEQHVWAAMTAKAKNEAFNCTNGDFFTWKKMWKVLSEEFKVDFVEYKEEDEFDIVEMMSKKGPVWEEIVEKHGLYKTKLEEIACYPPFKVVSNFKFQHVSSMNKSKEYGFFGFADSFKSVRLWVARLRHMKIIP
ncbi:hypothetical protein QN277_026854 [Acacia crassicarpa]|uniref:Uncharacterized protein n=2 Tax=Acacia crassicarpa TaxID=499986 RepID=A0AAE1J8P6_9FABA|nr:hypothetical protein QN277_026854 [Acacia crassicarpa]